MTTFAAKVGTAIYFKNLGQGYAELARGSMTASGFVTAGAAWLGMSKTHAILLGVASIGFWIFLAVGCGWVVWKWRIVHAQLERERDNSPVPVEMLSLLRDIARNTSPRWDYEHPGAPNFKIVTGDPEGRRGHWTPPRVHGVTERP